jgi:hypothetical protein
MNQGTTLSTTVPTSRKSSGLESDEKPAGLFATALTISQAASGRESSASKHPAGFARHARSIRPRTTHANDVVIPHVGQGLPVILKKEQERIPSWTCVPKPRGSGSTFLARPNSPIVPAAATRSAHRAGQPSG